MSIKGLLGRALIGHGVLLIGIGALGGITCWPMTRNYLLQSRLVQLGAIPNPLWWCKCGLDRSPTLGGNPFNG